MSEPASVLFREPYEDRALIPWVHALWAEYRLARGLSLPGGRGDRLFVETQFVPPGMSRGGRPIRAEALLRECGRVALTGEGGAGKSFYVRALIAGLCTRRATAWKELLGPRVPLPLLPARLGEGEGPEGMALLEHLLRQHPGPSEEIARELPSLLQSGQALVVLDGWDEVDDPRTRERLRAALVELAARHPKVGVLLTSSPGAWEDQPVEGFDQVELQPFGPSLAGRELWQRLQEVFGVELGRLFDGPRVVEHWPGDLFLRALLMAEGERRLPVERWDLLERVHERLFREWPSGADEEAPLALRRRWMEELALGLHRARVWGLAPRRPGVDEALSWLRRVEGAGSEALPRPEGPEVERRDEPREEPADGWAALRGYLLEGLREEGPLKSWLSGPQGSVPTEEQRAWLEGLVHGLLRAERADRRSARVGGGTFPPDPRPEMGPHGVPIIPWVTGSALSALPGSDGLSAEAFLLDGLRPGGLLVKEQDAIGFVHLDHQDLLAAGALYRRLCLGWLDPEEAQRRVGEIGRMALRSAGLGVVAALFHRLRRELPDLADQLAVEVFRERAAPRPAHRRLLRLAQALGYADQLARLAAALESEGEEREGGDLRGVRARALWADARGEAVDLGQLPRGGGTLYLRGAGRVRGARRTDWVVVTERGRLTTGEGAD